ncbi:amino acid adenylation domain-containing protein [Tenacibaculum sp. MAR_2009_124]|uniref:non-ribosomal peptide synthetase n=1 Tax=Tenacibaculum sp. MAR_2009_124 TaxID=1250059 RepID=UPI000897F7EF|nr:non-ribosomal peptide synthetase [Tenacibaculum sp. MAR_2009_124]SEC17951.1 amino acid adenylation domain-containing protein [Tenacibaculum sp. MAR_2009_124]
MEIQPKINLHLAQQDVFYSQLLNPDSSLYNIGGYVIFKGDFKTNYFKSALQKVPSVFDIFNLEFDFSNSIPNFSPKQSITKIDLEEFDFSNELTPQDSAKEWMQSEFNKPFDIYGNKLFQNVLIKISEDEFWWFMRYHHLITDGYGCSIKVNYVIDEYELLVNNKPSENTEFPKYFDIAQKNNEYLNSKQYERDAEYWKEKFTTIPKSVFQKKFENRTLNAGRYSISISDSDRNIINALTAKTSANLAQFSIAALSIYFGKTLNQKDFTIGVPTHNRGSRVERKTLGMFSSILPYKGHYDDRQTLAELLTNIKQEQRKDYRHRLYPTSHINRSLNLLSEDKLQLFDITVNYEFFKLSRTINDSLKSFSKNVTCTEEVSSPISFRWSDYGSEVPLILNIDYKKEYFEQQEIELIAERFLYIIRQFNISLDAPVKNISVIPENELQQLLHKFNDSTYELPTNKTILDFFEEQAFATPDNIALIHNDRQLTYEELNNRANQLANFLKYKGVQSNDIIGLLSEKTFEMLIGVLGILKANAAYVPISPDYPKQRIDFIIENTQIDILLHTSDTFLKKEELLTVNLKKDWNEISTFSRTNIERIENTDSLAYVIYTSGTTGTPKGVMVQHNSLSNYIQYQSQLFNFSSNEHVLQFSNFIFDASIEQFFLALTNGATLVLPSKNDILDTEKLHILIKDKNVTHLHATPSYLQQLNNLDECLELKRVISGGEVCSLSLAKRIPANIDFYNKYGPTEATISVTEHKFDPKLDKAPVLPIGRPIAHMEVYILNSKNEVCPIGVPGELCISGIGLSSGYLNNEELTKQKFTQHPLKKDTPIYKTGDIASWLPDGTIEFISRMDDQVKIRGHRIELGEIESSLFKLQQVKNCAVLAQKDNQKNDTLVGYLVLEASTSIESVKNDLKESLPEYMIPAIWVELDTIPLTPNGKLDKKALPQPKINKIPEDNYVAPNTPLEIELATIWQELLGISKIGIRDNFFKLGGHSILVIQLISKLRAKGYSIAVNEIFDFPTIERICQRLQKITHQFQASSNQITNESKKITPEMIPLAELNQKDIDIITDTIPNGVENIQDIYSLSPLQEGIHYHHLLSSEKEGDPYIFSCLFGFDSEGDRQKFTSALQKVIERHDVLRTCFISKGISQPVQIVQKEVSLPITTLTLDDSKETLSQLKSIIEPGNQWMDISKGSLINLQYADDNNKFYLIFNEHHLISDHVGLSKLIQEIDIILSDKQEKLDSPKLYREFIGQVRHLRENNNAETFFSELFSEISEPSYPFNLSNTSTSASRIKEGDLELSKEFSSEIKTKCKNLGISPASFFHAAFGLIVGQCSNTDYALFGSLFSGRLQTTSEVSESLGLFINTLPVLIPLKGNVKEYLEQVHSHLNSLIPYEQTAISEIHNWTSIPNNTPLLSAVLNFRHSSADLSVNKTITLGHTEVTIVDAVERSNYPFSLNVDDYGDTFKLNAQLDQSIAPERLLNYMEIVLNQLLTDLNKEQKSISEINILPNHEQQLLVHNFNDTNTSYPDHKTIIDLFIEQVNKAPHLTAIAHNDSTFTYQELDEKSNQFANYLLSNGNLKIEESVAVILERSPWLIVAFLGILKAGGTYVPIDPKFPLERKHYIIEDSNSNTIIDQSFIEKFQKECSNISNDLPQRPITSNNLVYIIYTSGSTGKPKGVLIEHKAIMNTIFAQIDGFFIHKNSKCLQFASPSFDASISEILTSLLSESTLYIIDDKQKSDVNYFTNFIVDNGITIATIPPAFLQLLSIEKLAGIKTIVSAGEAISLDLAKGVAKHCNFINAYGPTETSICTSLFNEELTSLVSIGKPINNTQVYILNQNNSLLPMGATGELCVGGTGLTRGYLNREELTAKKFIQNPFSKSSNERIYKTGDLARWLPDGSLEFAGRVDDQVKIRGYRIELGEIENVLYSIKGVVQHSVITHKDKNNIHSLVAYVVLNDELTKETVQEKLKKKLPEYMIPSIWIELKTMPITSNGKVNKKALPIPEEVLVSSSTYKAARNEFETKLVSIWQELLSIDKIGIHDNFFELGGHSLLATRLVSQIRTKLDLELTIKEVFEHRTIAEISTLINNNDNNRNALPTITREHKEFIPLSFSQERLWFLDQLQGSTEYHMPFVINLEGDLDTEVLEKSFQLIIERHQTLRTLLISENGSEYQKVISEINWKLQETYYPNQRELKNEIFNFLTSPFNLSEDYKIRVNVYKTDERKYVLACLIHHIASDGWSQAIFINELNEIYNSYSNNDTPSLANLDIQYSDYAIWQRKHLEGKIIDDQLNYWKEKLNDVPKLKLPVDFTSNVAQNNDAGLASLIIDKKLTLALNKVCKEEDVTLFMFLLTGFKVLLSRYSNQEDICVGTPIANRTQSELENIIGFFTNTLALRSDLSGNPTFKEALGTVKKTTLEAYDHQIAPFERVVKTITSNRDLNSTPLFQVMFALQNTFDDNQKLQLDNIHASKYDFDRSLAKFDLSLDALESNGVINLSMTYRKNTFTKDTVNQLLKHYKILLEQFVENRIQNIHSVSLLDTNEEQKLLIDFQNTNHAYPKNETLATLFTKQVINTPHHIAISQNERELTYKELDKKSNQLGHFLLKKGVRKGDIIGLCMDRSPELIIGILGILKAGAAYVPIDSDYPEKRTEHIINDTSIEILISDQHSSIEAENREDIFVLKLDKDWSSIETLSKETPMITSNSSDLSYIIYTSGSTGLPKGVMIENQSVVNLISYQSKKFNITDSERILLFSNYVFDASVEQLFMTLLNGARLVILSKDDLLNPDNVIQLVNNQKITHIHATPSYLSQLEGIENCESIRRIVSGGEKCSFELAKKLSKKKDFYNEYGPTETTVTATELLFDSESNKNEVVSIGKPIGNTQAYILNSENKLQPIGVYGELCLAGDGLARGYLNQPELTSEKFIEHPFNQGERIYKTGDIVRWLPDGTLDFLERNDGQVKIRGYRIELGEIENTLLKIEEVRNGCISAKKDKNNQDYLVGYIVFESAPINKNVIIKELKKNLPEYMIPKVWVEIDALPLTVNGKLDKKALPEIDSVLTKKKELITPRSATEKKLFNIWQQLLNLEKFSIDDNFFELGGHSLLATRLVSVIKLELGVNISIREIFENATIEGLGILIDLFTTNEKEDEDEEDFNQIIEI